MVYIYNSKLRPREVGALGRALKGLGCQFVGCKPELALGLLSVWVLFHHELHLLPWQMLTFIMLARLATLCPAPVLQRVDRLIEPLRATCTAKVSPALPRPWSACWL